MMIKENVDIREIYEYMKKLSFPYNYDTALSNQVAQHFYEKNDFVREGLTRSYIKE